MNQRLQPPDSFHLQAAQGWAEPGNHAEANGELEKIGPSRPSKRVLRRSIRSRNGRETIQIANALVWIF
jgi:hypothetical protein